MDELALQLIEHELGRSFRPVETTETVRLSASFAPLKHRPILSIRQVKGRMLTWEHSEVFGNMPSVEIPLTEIECTSEGVILPLTLWGSYQEATITYMHGYDEIPDDISVAVSIVADGLEQMGGAPSSYVAQLLLKSEEVETLLKPYKRG